MTPIEEITPGLFHFAQMHEKIGFEVDSYYLYAERVLIDPMTPAEGLLWFTEQERGPPTDILLSCRHHYRHSADYVDQFETKVHCVKQGMHEFADLEGPAKPQPFEFGDVLPGGVVASHVDAISPDETALYIPTHKALVCSDGVIQFEPGKPLGFIWDKFMDDPPKTKQGLIDAYRKLLELDFKHLLLAHGGPLIDDGKKRLKEFVEAGPDVPGGPRQ